MPHRIPGWPLLAMLAVAPLLNAAEPLLPQLVVTPRARALPVSATNRPFLAATHVVQPVDLAAAGFREAEYLVRGNASIYEWTGAPRDAAVAVREAGVPYTTRMLVRRPVDAGKASGLVVVELLNPTGLYDFAPLWGFSWQHFMRRGDVWVGVTVKPVAAATLKRFDPVRYGSLSFGYTQAPDCRPAPAGPGTPGAGDPRVNPPDAENGLAWDLIAQVGALLRSSSKENPLLDIAPRHIIAAGYSQTGGYAITYANAFHRVMRLGDGAPVYDGYLNAAGANPAPINQCAAPLAADDPRRTVLPRDVPFVMAMTESDFNRNPLLRREDSDDPADVFRLYEISGSGHAGPFDAGVPKASDLAIAGFAPPADGLCLEPRGDYPVGLAFNAIWQQYADWLTARIAMASVPRIQTDAGHLPLRDANGNVLGGWRLPHLDLPLAAWSGSGTPREDSERARTACALTGVKQSFDTARLKEMYRSRADYLRQFEAAVDQAVTERRLAPADGDALKQPAARIVPAF
jgi:hypothetical protein